ncbi:hypothetical protein SAMN05428988_0120 [Chitinophaga sp. YR573]|uniref:hypothetical protein n=1 Tax=Chitinophaga sp. YR573 TaxID=1881040 RepID=UPI0008C33511|nr:hypothetical protein [Chitinophaga sp. YR573]SEV88564.1 hypothetical protein SAMN05428988_0120 [Chitinophaga sp. YR573]
MSNRITIKDAAITSGHGLRLVYVKREKDGSFTDSKSSFSAAVHNDLELAFAKLFPHLAISVEYYIPKEGEDIEKMQYDFFDYFKVSTVSFLSEDTGVVISGSRRLSTGKSIPVTSPPIKWEESEDKGYPYVSELAELIEQIKTEINAYLAGKHAPEVQQQLAFPGADDGVDDDESI